MNWYKKASNKTEFDYTDEQKATWREVIKEGKEALNVFFDMENNDNRGDVRKLDTGAKNNLDKKVYVLAQLYGAGGDWECPIAYFRCQFYTGKSSIDNEKFIFIPAAEDGNGNLLRNDDGKFIAWDGDTCQKIDDNKCWKALKEVVQKFGADHIEGSPKYMDDSGLLYTAIQEKYRLQAPKYNETIEPFKRTL